MSIALTKNLPCLLPRKARRDKIHLGLGELHVHPSNPWTMPPTREDLTHPTTRRHLPVKVRETQILITVGRLGNIIPKLPECMVSSFGILMNTGERAKIVPRSVAILLGIVKLSEPRRLGRCNSLIITGYIHFHMYDILYMYVNVALSEMFLCGFMQLKLGDV